MLVRAIADMCKASREETKRDRQKQANVAFFDKSMHKELCDDRMASLAPILSRLRFLDVAENAFGSSELYCDAVRECANFQKRLNTLANVKHQVDHQIKTLVASTHGSVESCRICARM